MKYQREQYCKELESFQAVICLEDLVKLLPNLQKKYGKKAQLIFDAGANNISVLVMPTKKVKE